LNVRINCQSLQDASPAKPYLERMQEIEKQSWLHENAVKTALRIRANLTMESGA
jgi:hypothetical protein